MDINSGNKSDHTVVIELLWNNWKYVKEKRQGNKLGKWADFKIACAEGGKKDMKPNNIHIQTQKRNTSQENKELRF